MLSFPKRLLADETGATAIEYALIASLVSVVVIGGARSIGLNLETTFTYVASLL